jgi:hypothetical protein
LNENRESFKKHFDHLDRDYPHKNNLIIVNLVEEAGKESLLGDAFVELLSEASVQGLTYVQFDFHEHW